MLKNVGFAALLLFCVYGVFVENVDAGTESNASAVNCTTAGQGNVNGTCTNCPKGTWSNGDDSTNSTCDKCPDGKTTIGTNSTNVEDCNVFFCTAGKGLVNDTCEECSIGTWNNGNDTMKFEECTNCTAGKTTKSKGATSVKNCTSTVATSTNKGSTKSDAGKSPTVPATSTKNTTTTKTSDSRKQHTSPNKLLTPKTSPKAAKATTSTTTAPTTSTTADPMTVETLVKFDPKTLGTFLNGTSKELTVAGTGQDSYIHFDPTNATKPVELIFYDKTKNVSKDPKATKTTVTFQYKVGEGVDVKLMYNNKTMWTSTNGTTKNWTNETYIVTNEIASKIYFVMTKNNKTMDPKNVAGFDVKGFDVKRKTTHRTTTTATVTAPSTSDPITVETLVKFDPKTMKALVNGSSELTVDGSGKDSYIHFDPTNAKKPVELNVFDKPKDKTKNANATETTVTFKYKVGEGVDVNLVYNGKTIWTKNITSRSWQNASVNVPGDIASKIKFVLTKNNKTIDPKDVVGFDVKDLKVQETTDHSKSKGSKPPPPTAKSDKNNGGLSTTTIVAIAVPIAVVVLLVVVLVVYKVCFKKNKVSVDKHGGKEASGSSTTNVSDTVPMHSRNSNP